MQGAPFFNIKGKANLCFFNRFAMQPKEKINAVKKAEIQAVQKILFLDFPKNSKVSKRLVTIPFPALDKIREFIAGL